MFLRALFASLRRRARRQGMLGRLQCGAVSFLQRFGSAINLNCHIHTLALDGVYPVSGHGPTRFHPLAPPDDEEVGRVVVLVLVLHSNSIDLPSARSHCLDPTLALSPPGGGWIQR